METVAHLVQTHPRNRPESQNWVMLSRGHLEERIRELSDEVAIRALSVVVEERGLLPVAVQCPWNGSELRVAPDSEDLEAYLRPGQPEGTDGELARAALEYVATLGDDAACTVSEAIEYAQSPMERFDPVALSVTVLVAVLLQTEVVVKRDTRGRWSLAIHKRALRDAALGRVFAALLSRITSGK
ncbi:hypothetical protein ND808_08705 [Streptomyces sp. DR7-3]|uniref:hypothetical protein n=1 Tax=Streptomyces malaysiensis TaxID=92644 RepID=UPI002043E1E6|nr:hypothetical protein [Streptomyces sp. DR7-3]MCM3805957.1 hypothetical protein [Streptomyces sp. DR7-3]